MNTLRNLRKWLHSRLGCGRQPSLAELRLTRRIRVEALANRLERQKWLARATGPQWDAAPIIPFVPRLERPASAGGIR